MIFRRKRSFISRTRTDFRLEEERTRMRAVGLGVDGFVRVKDDSGNIWSGLVETNSENTVRYYLSDTQGRRITGLANSNTLVFRDDLGRIWKGILD